MNDLREKNTIYLMHVASGAYARAYHMTPREFLSFDDAHHVLRYIRMCPDVFDALPESEMVKEIDAYVSCCS